MDSDRNLQFAQLARDVGLLDAPKFEEACRLCRDNPVLSLPDWLTARGWLVPEDREHLDYLLERKRHLRAWSATIVSGAEPAASTDAGRQVPRTRAGDADRTMIQSGDLTHSALEPVDNPTNGSGSRYTFKHLHAVGGMGRVWRAWDHQLGREVAIKELRPEVARSRVVANRFLREARLTGQLEHPGIIPVHELYHGVDDRGPFYAMRLVQGRTLHAAIADYHRKRAEGHDDPLGFIDLLAAFVGACNTVAYAHSHGVIHRDLKGDNVILGDFGEVVVLDWGLAKLVGSQDEEADDTGLLDSGSAATHPGLTMQGQVVGTPAYMSPEQAAGRLDLVDHRTDIYGLGAILYEMLTGRPPFMGNTTVEVLRQAQRGEPVPPSQICPHVATILEEVCLRALAKERGDRYSSATELAVDVQRWQESQRQEAEEELRHSRERFELAVRGSQDGLWDWDLTTDVVYFSPRWKSIIGYEDHEIANDVQEWIVRLHPEESERVLAANYAHIHGTTEHYEYEYRLRHKDGSYRWILARGVALRDASGKAYRMAGSHVDVTDRRRTEQELRESQELHRILMESLSVGVAVIDADQKVRAHNSAAKQLLGLESTNQPYALSATTLSGAVREDGSLVHWESRPITELLERGTTSHPLVIGLRAADGPVQWCSLSVASIPQEGETQPRSTVVCLAPVGRVS